MENRYLEKIAGMLNARGQANLVEKELRDAVSNSRREKIRQYAAASRARREAGPRGISAERLWNTYGTGGKNPNGPAGISLERIWNTYGS